MVRTLHRVRLHFFLFHFHCVHFLFVFDYYLYCSLVARNHRHGSNKKEGVYYAENIGQIFNALQLLLIWLHVDVGCKINKGGGNEQINYLKRRNEYVNTKVPSAFWINCYLSESFTEGTFK